MVLEAGTAKRGSPAWASPKTRSTLCTLSLYESFQALIGASDELHSHCYKGLKSASVYGKNWASLKASHEVFRDWCWDRRCNI